MYRRIHEVKQREMIFCIVISLVMLIIGFMINDKITSGVIRNNKELDQAIQITESEKFKFALETGKGLSFIYGDMIAINPVSITDIQGEYLYIRKTQYRYTEHSRLVDKCTGSGENEVCRTEIEYYYTWDSRGSDEWHVDEIEFSGVNFKYSDIDSPSSYHKETIYEHDRLFGHVVGDLKWEYRVCKPKYTGTLFANLKEGKILDNSFYNEQKPSEVLESKKSNGKFISVAFWIFWIVIISGVNYIFVRLENSWLD